MAKDLSSSKKHKPYLLIFEGVDRTGKDSLMYEVARLTNFRHINMVRGPVGFSVYNELYDKGIDLSYYKEMELKLRELPHLMIYLTASLKTLEQRFLFTNEKPLPHNHTLEKHLNAYEKMIRLSCLNTLVLDTTAMSTYELACIIVAYLEA